MTALVLHEVSIGERLVDVCCDNGVITDVTAPARQVDRGIGNVVVIEGGGRPVLPGLHDHHIHLLATAAAIDSVVVGPPRVNTRDELLAALRGADTALARGEWLRAVAYHESVAGHLDREGLDDLLSSIPGFNRPVRVQHRSGALWILNTVACDTLGLAADDHRRVSGHLWREDEWLRDRLTPTEPPDLTDLGRKLAALGVTGVTDATPMSDESQLTVLADAARQIPQKIHAMVGVDLAGATFPAGLDRGPVKIVIPDHDLPAIDDLVTAFTTAHHHGRNVAVHCVTRVALVLALAAWDQAGAIDGDRIEHGSVIPEGLIPRIAALGLRVVTQPNFIGERGDEYLTDVDEADLDDLYRLRSLLDSGIRVAGGTDSPYGNFDPWKAIAAAMNRHTPRGQVIGATEALGNDEAVGLFLSPADDPGGSPRSISRGQPADLIIVNRSLPELVDPRLRNCVDVTVIAGVIAHESGKLPPPGRR